MKSFNYVNTKTVADAIKLLKNYKGKAKLIVGETGPLGALRIEFSQTSVTTLGLRRSNDSGF